MQGAHLTITNELQGTTRESTSNADGSFTIPNLVPGSYTVVLSAPALLTLDICTCRLTQAKQSRWTQL